jgi:hypothetical protein
MILCVINCMACSFQFHTVKYNTTFLPTAGELFIPVYKTGYSSSNYE